MSYTLSAQTPALTYIAWSNAHISYNGENYPIDDGNSNKKYVYWTLANPTIFQSIDEYPVLGAEDCIIFINNGGVGTSILESSIIDGGLVVPGTIQGTAIHAEAITAGHISSGAITADKIDANAINGKTITGAILRYGKTGFTDSTRGYWTDGFGNFAIGGPTHNLTFNGATGIMTLNGQLVTGSNIAPAAIDSTKFASGIEPITIVSTLPGAKVTSNVFNATDGKLYRWNGTEYVTTVPAADVTGQLTNDQIAGIDAAKLTTKITSTQITDGAISTPLLAAGAVKANNIFAGTITGDKIAANTISAGNIAADTITADKIAANTITAAEIAADTITAGEIAAGAISATELAAGAVTATKINVTNLSSISSDLGTITGGSIRIGSAATGATTVFKVDASGNHWSGNATFGAAPFRVDNAGNLTASSANITGTLTVGSYIGATPIADVLSGSAAGTAASNALTGKLDKAASSIIDANFALKTSTYDAGTGMAIYNGGIVGKKNSATTFAIDSAGNATFKGDISGSNGSFAGTLSATSGTLGTITAGNMSGVNMTVGVAPPVIDAANNTISSGAGARFNSNGNFAVGDPTTNITYNGSAIKLNGKIILPGNIDAANLGQISTNLGTITAGSLNIGSGTFTVSSGGALTASSATISGNVTASSGSITGPLNFGGSGKIYSGSRSTFGSTSQGFYLDGAGQFSFGSNATRFISLDSAGNFNIGQDVLINGTNAGIVVSNAAAGAAVAAQLTGKLNNSASDTLAGTISFATTGAFKIGSVVWTPPTVAGQMGTATGSGMLFNQKGIVGVKPGGEISFVLDAVNGNAIFKGDITGATGTFGGVFSGTVNANQINAVGNLSGHTITGSNITAGSSPAISGTTMTGSGAKINSDGSLALGNSSRNIVFNGSGAYLNGFVNQTGSQNMSFQMNSGIVSQISNYTTPDIDFITLIDKKFSCTVQGTIGWMQYGSSGCVVDIYVNVTYYVNGTMVVGDSHTWSHKLFVTSTSGNNYMWIPFSSIAVSKILASSGQTVTPRVTVNMSCVNGNNQYLWALMGAPTLYCDSQFQEILA